MNTDKHTNYDVLIELINRATPDSLNIAQAILNKNEEIYLPNLPLLQNYVEQSLKDKANRQLSQKVRTLKKEILETLEKNYFSTSLTKSNSTYQQKIKT
jgi:hypothetical protein